MVGRGRNACTRNLPPRRMPSGGRHDHDATGPATSFQTAAFSPCGPSRKGPRAPASHDKVPNMPRHEIKITFARLKDWRRIATRRDGFPKVHLPARAFAAAVMFWP